MKPQPLKFLDRVKLVNEQKLAHHPDLKSKTLVLLGYDQYRYFVICEEHLGTGEVKSIFGNAETDLVNYPTTKDGWASRVNAPSNPGNLP